MRDSICTDMLCLVVKVVKRSLHMGLVLLLLFVIAKIVVQHRNQLGDRCCDHLGHRRNLD